MALSERNANIIDTTNVNEKVYSYLRTSILDFTYPPGHKLTFKELQETLGVSKTPIKDALFRLVGEGLVEINSRKGTYVTNVTKQDMRDIIEMRAILESAVVGLLATKISDKQLEALEGLYQRTLDGEEKLDFSTFMLRDWEFHLALFEFANNKRLFNTYKNLSGHMQKLRYHLLDMRKGRMPWTDRDHEAILVALKKHDPIEARKAVEIHILRQTESLSLLKETT